MNEQQFEQYKNIPDEKFVFAQQDGNLRDKKLDTKAVSFARDSFRRFCKNKSSVVAAIILGIIILLAIFVPVITGSDTTRVSAAETFLQPKLFPAGTGFWDGTKSYEHVIYDTDNKVPADAYGPAVIKCDVDEQPTYINSASKFGKGGYIMFENQTSDGESVTYLRSDDFDVTSDGEYKVQIAFGTENDALGSKLGEYRILFHTENEDLLLKDWSENYSDCTIDLSAVLSSNDVSTATGSVTFELKSIADAYSYILVKSVLITANDGASNLEELQTVGFSDATQMVLLARNEQGIFPEGYWTCTGRKGIYQSQVYYCDYVLDTYEKAYGKTDIIIAKSELDKYVANGWCSYTFDRTTKEFTFTKLSDDCPIDEVPADGIKLNPITGNLLEIKAQAYKYRQMGYDEMPSFLFGTDASGVDVLTRMFKGLRTSLMLGVFTFLFCFLFGLVWGAVSGYFGGTVDLAMERFTDILGGVPWIVVMTLCILHLGNNFFTFFLALCMTGWMGTAGTTRTQFYRFKKQEHVLAARTLGASDWRLIFKHILPNSMGTIITSSVLMIPSVIYSEASLAYLNLGLQGMASFGVMLSDNQKYLQSDSYLIVLPSILIALLMISFNLFGNGLRDAVNPTLKGSEG